MLKDLPQEDPKPALALVAAGWSVTTVAVLLVIKTYAYVESGSAAILATLMDSVIDAGVSVILFLAIRLSLKPADTVHRHGHGKVEGLAALFQAAMMFGGAAFLVFEAAHRFIHPDVVEHHVLSGSIAALAIVLSVILISVQRYVLKRAPSLALEADRAHYTTDIALNGSVIAALAIDYYGGPHWVDPAVALCIAGYFAWTSWGIGMQGTDMLMDREMPDAVRKRIIDIVNRHDEALGIHDLRTRKSGMVLHISFDVEIDPHMTLSQAHDVTRELENMILADFPYAEVLIHMDPHGDTYDARHSVKGVHH